MKLLKLTPFILGILLLIPTGVLADPVVYVFNSSSVDGNTTLDGSQFTLTISGSGPVTMTISNLGPVASFVGEVYWDDDASVLGALTLPSGWFAPADPAHLPGDSSIGSPNADAGSGAGRIFPGESEVFIFALLSGKTVGDVVAALDSGDLRVGIHVKGIDDSVVVRSDSDAFTNNGRKVPEPSTLLLLGTGLLGIGLLQRRRK